MVTSNMKIAARILLALTLWLSIFTFAFPVQGQVYEGKQLVVASLVADTDAIVPGKPFTAGLLLRMVPGWHTYWKFSGDAGIPIELKWQLPPGWKVGELQWPIPMKFNDPGDIQTYGYHDEVLLMQEITPPASIPDSKVKLSAEANWLVCEKICVPGSANLQLELPRSTSSLPANTELFARFRRLLPESVARGRCCNFAMEPLRQRSAAQSHECDGCEAAIRGLFSFTSRQRRGRSSQN